MEPFIHPEANIRTDTADWRGLKHHFCTTQDKHYISHSQEERQMHIQCHVPVPSTFDKHIKKPGV